MGLVQVVWKWLGVVGVGGPSLWNYTSNLVWWAKLVCFKLLKRLSEDVVQLSDDDEESVRRSLQPAFVRVQKWGF